MEGAGGALLQELHSVGSLPECWHANSSRSAMRPLPVRLLTRAGTDCVERAITALTDANPITAVLSSDGIAAYEHVQRSAFLKNLHSVPSLQGLLPFVRATYGDPTTYMWEDEARVLHRLVLAEGGEQGDPLMPLLFSLAIHDPLEESSRELRPKEHLFAYLDDVYFSTDVPDRTRTAHDSLGEELVTAGRDSIAHRQDPSLESCIRVSCGNSPPREDTSPGRPFPSPPLRKEDTPGRHFTGKTPLPREDPPREDTSQEDPSSSPRGPSPGRPSPGRHPKRHSPKRHPRGRTPPGGHPRGGHPQDTDQC